VESEIKIKEITAIFVLISLIVFSAIGVVAAQTSPTATDIDDITFKANGIEKDVFLTSDNVDIYFSPTPDGGTVNIQIFYEQVSDGQLTLVLISTIGPVASGEGNFKPAIPGDYYLVFIGPSGKTGKLHVIGDSELTSLPESALGTAIATFAGFAAVGTFGIIKYKRTNIGK
jgi:hypothetical protein